MLALTRSMPGPTFRQSSSNCGFLNNLRMQRHVDDLLIPVEVPSTTFRTARVDGAEEAMVLTVSSENAVIFHSSSILAFTDWQHCRTFLLCFFIQYVFSSLGLHFIQNHFLVCALLRICQPYISDILCNTVYTAFYSIHTEVSYLSRLYSVFHIPHAPMKFHCLISMFCYFLAVLTCCVLTAKLLKLGVSILKQLRQPRPLSSHSSSFNNISYTSC